MAELLGSILGPAFTLAMTALLIAVASQMLVKRSREKAQALEPEVQTWLASSEEGVMKWLAARPGKMVADLFIILFIFVGFLLGVVVTGAVYGLVRLVLATLMSLPPFEGWFIGLALTLAVGFFAGLVMGGCVVQHGPFRKYWMVTLRKGVENGQFAQWELVQALISAARNGWHTTEEPFDPEAFYKSWTSRQTKVLLKAARWILVFSATMAGLDFSLTSLLS